MFCMIFGIAAWFMSDGYYFWPNEAQRYVEFSQVRDELEAAGKPVEDDSQELRVAWERYAREVGYSAKKPKERTDASIQEQRVIGWVMIVGSLGFLGWIAWNHKLTIEAHGEMITGASGQKVEIDRIVATDRKKRKNKGIANGIYQEGGKEKRLCLDDHKFAGCEAILLEAEARIKARSDETEESDTEES